ncbi:MAG TPA: TylF/MycF/NovP-related O-methyltransferase [Allosphingosinicella sp.]|nr:TylF/MycF/NovP-related O-methyltransferase [Allosphingosinicella sp.]
MVDSLVVASIRRSRWKLGDSTVPGVMHRQALEESASFAREHMATAMLFEDLAEFRSFAFSKKTVPGLNLEFGVHEGAGVNLFASLTSELVFGFDSFEGLREDWSGSNAAVRGFFDRKGRLPRVRPNVRLLKGWFQDTLRPFLAERTEKVSFANLDADTYESTAYVLDELSDRIVEGTILIFDEYFGYAGWKQNEYRAWQEFVARKSVTYTYLAICEGRVALRVNGLS